MFLHWNVCFVHQAKLYNLNGSCGAEPDLDGSLGICAVDSRSISVGLMLEEVAPGQVSESTSSVSSVSITAPLFHIHSFIHSFTHSLVHSFGYSFIRYSFIQSFIRSFIHSFIHSFFNPFTHSFIHSLTHSFIHSLQTPYS